ncbi:MULTISPECIES: penicillin-binding protein activator [unclassified Brenneria]|uniref:penicillin-binding protein activator n=1 Tax=unclassified Brenneria TaxID=2634434 RepID=UPI0029C204A2|nr:MULTISPECIES: penicillin-binding protein activator [unclassified Brenneria]MDX5629504.1 penicillin-binding protein activator [Brenneria sp. L3-3Z]MDX5696643.1 penicillin-binding protein activator [Brenneria sp. L4-2C]MEE3663469.1 penicillin-binding protein activator [Brenneria sp. g21c3]
MLSFRFVRTQAGRIIPVLLTALFLAGCPSQAPQSPPSEVQGKAGASADYYLQQMQQSGDNNKTAWQLLAIRALLQEGKVPQASQQFSALPTDLSAAQKQERQLLSAELSAAQRNMAAANQALSQLEVGALSAQQQLRYYDAQILANQGQPSATLLRAYIAQEPLLQDSAARQSNIDQTWLALVQMTPQASGALLINADENVLQGWIDLLGTYQNNRQSPDQLKSAIEDWRTRYPRHPAAQTLPTQLVQFTDFHPSQVSGIALLLPLNGQAQVFANAIQQGFNAAKNGQAAIADSLPAAQTAADSGYQPGATPVPNAEGAGDQDEHAVQNDQYGQNAEPPAEYSGEINPPAAQSSTPLPSSLPVKVYDTSSQPLANVLTQAQQDGASLVIGPLLKNEVEQLAANHSPLSILALNQPEHVQNSPNICYFALSPEDEARDAAKFIHQQGKQQPLLLVPRGNLGDRIVNAFAQAWSQQGGGTLLQQRLGSTIELKQAINSGAGLRLSGQPVNLTPQTTPSGATIGGLTIPSQVEPVIDSSISGNIDAVYIIATPDELSLIKPMIDMRTTSRSRPALYASSRSFQAGSGPDFRLEMEGLQFSEIPLLAGANPALMQQVSNQFKNDYSLVRLYAMGMDAWKLSSHFAELRQMPGHQVAGATGTLSATTDCVINRQMTWLQYRQGQLVPAS